MRIPLSLLCIFAITIVSASCQKEFEDPNISVIPPASSLDTFQVDIDGIAFPTYGISSTNTLNIINLLASDVQSVKKVSITIPATIAAGSYPLDYQGMVFYGIYYFDASNFLVSDPGIITIISNNTSTKRISGTFDFNATDLTTGTAINFLTNGYFSVKYP